MQKRPQKVVGGLFNIFVTRFFRCEKSLAVGRIAWLCLTSKSTTSRKENAYKASSLFCYVTKLCVLCGLSRWCETLPNPRRVIFKLCLHLKGAKFLLVPLPSQKHKEGKLNLNHSPSRLIQPNVRLACDAVLSSTKVTTAKTFLWLAGRLMSLGCESCDSLGFWRKMELIWRKIPTLNWSVSRYSSKEINRFKTFLK